MGGAYEWAKSYNFSILLGWEFVHKGCQITSGIKYHTVNGDYLQVPFLLIPKIELKNETYLAFKLGVAAAIRVASNNSKIYEDCRYVDENGDYHHEELGRLAVNDDFGGGIIAGVALDMEKWTLGMEYCRGLLSDEYLQVIGAVIEIKF